MARKNNKANNGGSRRDRIRAAAAQQNKPQLCMSCRGTGHPSLCAHGRTTAHGKGKNTCAGPLGATCQICKGSGHV